MKTLQQLINNTPSDVVARARLTTAVVLNVEMVKKRELNALVFLVRCKAHTETVYYDTIIELYPLEVHKDVFERPSFNTPAWVQCSCPYYTFHAEYALAKAGSSEIKYSNGKPPLIKNPRMIPYLCKHLLKAAPEVVRRSLQLSQKSGKYSFST